ncbi:endonuclease/exonuclease/phosphatase family protein [Tenacibaculum sediminilitoris]|uniref:endonuclease/exonuclease/phosphatase family protein n=1 Tax=Tenacibaculum sediminilitoris TaxID=1820334 RepID=UPI0038B58FBF
MFNKLKKILLVGLIIYSNNHFSNTVNKIKDDSYQVKVMTYNVHLDLPLKEKDDELRVTEISKKINMDSSEFDIIIFSEVWTNSYAKLIIESTKKKFPYNMYSNMYSAKIGDGLLIISKIPLAQSTFYPFDSYSSLFQSTDYFANKGFWVVQCLFEHKYEFYVIATHAQSDESSKYKEEYKRIRKEQFTQIKNVTKGISSPVIIAGDFNIIGDSDEYNTLKEEVLINYKDSYHMSKPDDFGYTFNNLDNTLANYYYNNKESQYKQRLDYIFHSNNITTVESKVLKEFKYYNKEVNEYWDASDHYPVLSTLLITDKVIGVNKNILNNIDEAKARLESLKNGYGTGVSAKIIISNNSSKTLYFKSKDCWYYSIFYSLPPSIIPSGKVGVAFAVQKKGESTGVFNRISYDVSNDSSLTFSFGSYIPWSFWYTNNILISDSEFSLNDLNKKSSKSSEKTFENYKISAKIDSGTSPYVFFTINDIE